MDKFDKLFQMQAELNNRCFSKKNILNDAGDVLTMEYMMKQALSGTVGSNESVNQWLRNYLTALEDESRELRDELLWKWWSDDGLNMQNIRVEIIDQLHFWISLSIIAGMDSKKAFEVYAQKHKINQERQDKGYILAEKTEEDNNKIIA